MPEDLYALLGVARDADLDTLKKAYRRLARELHPDRNPSATDHAEARFKVLGRAYAVLSDSKKRATYDASWKAAEARRIAKNVRRLRVSDVTVDDLAGLAPLRGPENGLEMLGSFFRRTRPTERGADRHATLTLSLGDALRGATVDLEGLAQTPLRVVVPAGTTDGATLRVAEMGAASSNVGSNGDLVLTVRVEKNPRFYTRGSNLHLDLPITLREAYVGSTIAVPTPDGTIALRIPPRSQTGTVLRVKGHGVPGRTAGDANGHLLVRLEVHVPTDERREIGALIERLAAFQEGDVRAGLTL